MPINYPQLSKQDFAPKITLHNLEAEALYVAKRLNQDPIVIEYILRDYWKDKVAVEMPLQQIKERNFNSLVANCDLQRCDNI